SELPRLITFDLTLGNTQTYPLLTDSWPCQKVRWLGLASTASTRNSMAEQVCGGNCRVLRPTQRPLRDSAPSAPTTTRAAIVDAARVTSLTMEISRKPSLTGETPSTRVLTHSSAPARWACRATS